jgi:hypothetical protein
LHVVAIGAVYGGPAGQAAAVRLHAPFGPERPATGSLVLSCAAKGEEAQRLCHKTIYGRAKNLDHPLASASISIKTRWRRSTGNSKPHWPRGARRTNGFPSGDEEKQEKAPRLPEKGRAVGQGEVQMFLLIFAASACAAV